MLGLTLVDLMPEFNVSSFRRMIAPLVKGAVASRTFETLHRRKDDTKIPVEVVLQFIAPPGETERFVSIVRDITERRRAEEERTRLCAMFRKAPCGSARSCGTCSGASPRDGCACATAGRSA